MSLSHAPRINTSAVICTCNLRCRERNFARIIGSLLDAFRRLFCICCFLLSLLLLLCSGMGLIFHWFSAKYGTHQTTTEGLPCNSGLHARHPPHPRLVYSSAADSVDSARLGEWHWHAACRYTQLRRYSTGREKQKYGQGADSKSFWASSATAGMDDAALKILDTEIWEYAAESSVLLSCAQKNEKNHHIYTYAMCFAASSPD